MISLYSLFFLGFTPKKKKCEIECDIYIVQFYDEIKKKRNMIMRTQKHQRHIINCDFSLISFTI